MNNKTEYCLIKGIGTLNLITLPSIKATIYTFILYRPRPDMLNHYGTALG